MVDYTASFKAVLTEYFFFSLFLFIASFSICYRISVKIWLITFPSSLPPRLKWFFIRRNIHFWEVCNLIMIFDCWFSSWKIWSQLRRGRILQKLIKSRLFWIWITYNDSFSVRFCSQRMHSSISSRIVLPSSWLRSMISILSLSFVWLMTSNSNSSSMYFSLTICFFLWNV